MSDAEIVGWVMFIGIAIAFIIIVLWWLSKQGEIIEKDERVKASDADLSATKEKAREVTKNAIIMAKMTQLHEREMINDLNQNSKNGQSVQPFQFKSIEADVQAQRIMYMESDEVQYKQEIANSRIGDYNTKIKQPFTSMVAVSMGKKEKPYLDKADKNIFSDSLKGAGKELIALGEKVKEEDKKQLTDGSE